MGGKIGRWKKIGPPSRIHGKQIPPPPHDTVGKKLPPPPLFFLTVEKMPLCYCCGPTTVTMHVM